MAYNHSHPGSSIVLLCLLIKPQVPAVGHEWFLRNMPRGWLPEGRSLNEINCSFLNLAELILLRSRQGHTFPNNMEQSKSVKHRWRCPLSNGHAVPVPWAACYLISPLRPQGGDGAGKPSYSLLCANTSRASMPGTQVNTMTHVPRHSGKLQDTIQRHPGGCQVLFLALRFPKRWQRSLPETISWSSSSCPPETYRGQNEAS